MSDIGDISKVAVSTEEILAADFLSLRLNRFQKLRLSVRKLILEIVQYYLSAFPADDEAAAICVKIEEVKPIDPDVENLTTACYKAFLEWMPFRLKGSIQGKNLFKMPTEHQDTHNYINDIEMIKVANKKMFGDNKNGITQADELRLAMIELENELGINILDIPQPGI